MVCIKMMLKGKIIVVKTYIKDKKTSNNNLRCKTVGNKQPTKPKASVKKEIIRIRAKIPFHNMEKSKPKNLVFLKDQKNL